MKWFCPFCWKEINANTTICPHCSANLSEFNYLTYEEKLILALKNPIRENRNFAIFILGITQSINAIKPLCNLAKNVADTIELLEIARALKRINTAESKKCLKELSVIDNKLLKNFLKNLGGYDAND